MKKKRQKTFIDCLSESRKRGGVEWSSGREVEKSRSREVEKSRSREVEKSRSREVEKS